jgi:hypothetical protein
MHSSQTQSPFFSYSSNYDSVVDNPPSSTPTNTFASETTENLDLKNQQPINIKLIESDYGIF